MKKIFMLTGSYACLLFLLACSQDSKTEQKAEAKFPITNPIVIDTTYSKDYVATINSLQNVELRARIKGYVEAIFVDEGKPVRAGQVLFKISGQAYRQELLKAQAMLKSATSEAKTLELEIKNTKLLVEQNVVAKSELDIVESKLEALKAKIEEAQSDAASAQLQLSLTDIKAPFSGTISRIPNKVGSLVDDGTLLTTISNNQEVFAYFNVSEKEYLDFTAQNEVNKRRSVSLLLANNQLYPQVGIIETIDSEFDKNSGNIAFRAKFPNPQQVLKNGASGKVRLTNPIKNALIVPQKSVFEVQDKNCVYVVDAQNTVSIRNVKILQRLPQLYVIESGLSTSDKILYEGIQNVNDGDKIQGQLVPMRQIMARLGKE
ncbi:MAG: efflux RND transporter periplasmic adaptor subunit [Cytophagia bacterium]|nr:MAG: efflux RND transporter periplasmic adaptor subunit [Cytophagales bacterium]TAG39616.1 MAG: efflux RND transporter periplasmic adaptor subunit [Cytophagia bacterium]TAG81194.1 MAG: efflux RND transporter periplasmic adaptor subunit [Cytophagales bacterium]